ncbi:Protein ROOT PRIMORDIUM DEFECTIVE like [Actinidia chinensis var. chinensis]|uniref:Protein ROOT PRIMORDIUM DEFECTIVE like n=1 Tax=Actinidia chinensis var. chinensis TaxID=1590841 RepID=A0A2R6P826_ACTCC|nr:Protein ROOT PRIMORDIUM DEFECTIVE like [Actinidia chinensis var. chinensis]
MAISLSFSSPDKPIIFLKSEFLPLVPLWKSSTINRNYSNNRNYRRLSISVAHSSPKIVRDRSLDRHVVKQNKIRFVQKLKTLLLSKPKHYLPLHILSKCRSYLSLAKPRSLLSMIHRYPSIFELFTIPTPPTPLNATKPYSQLCVRLTPAAAALATQESRLKSTMSVTLAGKLQKLLMLSSHHRLLLSKIVHLAPDLGLLPSFRSKLCNEHPDKFKTVDTSYGRALELVSWDPYLATTLPALEVKSGLIVDRPLKFKHLRLRKGINVKRSLREFLIKFEELPDVCPYKTPIGDLVKESIEAEKRACAVVREVLGMMVEKRTLVDHLTHFRKEFGLPNKLRGMLVRHPELFYVSLKGQRDSVFLVEGYDDRGALIENDEILTIKDQLMELVREGKRMRRERRNGSSNNEVDDEDDDESDDVYDFGEDDYDDGLDNLFESEDSGAYDGDGGGHDDDRSYIFVPEKREFWTAETGDLQPW